MRERRGIGIPVFGILFLSAGVILLLNTTGALRWSVWLDMWRLWPLLLVLWGISIIFRRFHPAVIAIIVLVSVGATVGFAFVADDHGLFEAELTDFEYTVQRGNATSLDLEIDFGAGKLTVGSLGPSDSRLVFVQFTDDEDRVTYTSTSAGSGVKTKLKLDGERAWLPWRNSGDREWTVLINPSVTAKLAVDGGAGDFTLNLRDTRVTEFDVSVGAANLDIEAPEAAGHVEGSIGAGVSDITVTIPPGVAARIDNDSGVSSVSIDTDRFPKADGIHMSPSYASAVNRIDLSISAGVSSITVE